MRGQTSLPGNSGGQAARNEGAETKWVFSVKATDARGLFNDGSEPTEPHLRRVEELRGEQCCKKRRRVQEWKLSGRSQHRARPFLTNGRLRYRQGQAVSKGRQARALPTDRFFFFFFVFFLSG